MKTFRHPVGCAKCKAVSGDDWSQCRGKCPVEGSPHFDPATREQYMPKQQELEEKMARIWAEDHT